MKRAEFVKQTNVLWDFIKTLQERFPEEHVEVSVNIGNFRRSTYGVFGNFDEDNNTEED